MRIPIIFILPVSIGRIEIRKRDLQYGSCPRDLLITTGIVVMGIPRIPIRMDPSADIEVAAGRS